MTKTEIPNIDETMRAAIFHGVDKQLTVEQVSVPEVRPGDLLIKVEYCGICGSDLHATQSGELVVPDGTVLGHEFSGEVVAKGDDVDTEWQVGDRVTAVPVNACQECGRQCKYGMGIHCPNNIITGFTLEAPGAYSEYIRADAGNVLRLPKQVGFKEGATAEPLAVGHHVIDKAQMRPGSNVLVIGGGPIGLASTAFARFSGARHVVMSEYSELRRNIALSMGATDTINPETEDVAEAFTKLTGGPPDIVIECVGVPGMLGQCIDLVAHQGKVMVCGVCTKPDSFVPLAALAKEVCLQWALGYQKRDFEVVLDLIASGRIDPSPMISHIIGFDELPARFEALRQPTDECKVLIKTGN